MYAIPRPTQILEHAHVADYSCTNTLGHLRAATASRPSPPSLLKPGEVVHLQRAHPAVPEAVGPRHSRIEAGAVDLVDNDRMNVREALSRLARSLSE